MFSWSDSSTMCMISLLVSQTDFQPGEGIWLWALGTSTFGCSFGNLNAEGSRRRANLIFRTAVVTGERTRKTFKGEGWDRWMRSRMQVREMEWEWLALKVTALTKFIWQETVVRYFIRKQWSWSKWRCRLRLEPPVINNVWLIWVWQGRDSKKEEHPPSVGGCLILWDVASKSKRLFYKSITHTQCWGLT